MSKVDKYKLFIVGIAILSCFSFLSTMAVPVLPVDDKETSPENIVGGEETTIERHPYQASIQEIYSNFQFCGGALISEDFVLTAAHCTFGREPSHLLIRLGSANNQEGGVLVPVYSIRNHESYNSETVENDIALIRLARTVRQTSKISYIPLSHERAKSGRRAVASGWGKSGQVYPTILRAVEVDVFSHEDCSLNYYHDGGLTDKMFCAGPYNKGICFGDSGGPIVSENRLIGIVSWHVGCDQKGFPSGYTDVAAYIEWIKEDVGVGETTISYSGYPNGGSGGEDTTISWYPQGGFGGGDTYPWYPEGGFGGGEAT